MPEELLDLPPPSFDERVSYGDGPSHFAELRRPSGAGPHPVVLCLHGGYWRAKYSLDHLGHLCAALAEAGFATWSLEYRRLGEEGGGFPGTFDDVLAGARALERHAPARELDASRVVLLGHSAGGQLALWLATKWRPASGVVALAPVADLELASKLRLSDGIADELVRGTTLEELSPRHRVPLGVRSLVLHGDRDDVVPLRLSWSFVDAAKRAGDDATLEVVPGADHYDLIDPRSAAFPHVLAAVRAMSSDAS